MLIFLMTLEILFLLAPINHLASPGMLCNHTVGLIFNMAIGTIGVHYDQFTPLLVNATQSLNSTVKGQDSKLSTLT